MNTGDTSASRPGKRSRTLYTLCGTGRHSAHQATIMATLIEIRTAIIKAISSRLTMMCIGTHNDDENNFGIRDVHTHYIGYFTDLEMVMYGFEDEWDIPFSLSDPDLIPKAAKFFKAWEDWHARNLVIYIDGV